MGEATVSKEYLIQMEQHPGEFDQFMKFVAEKGVQSYMEVGSKWGGTLWRVANALPVGSTIVSIDLPHGDRKTQPSLEACCEDLRQRGYRVHLCLADSTLPQTVEFAGKWKPYDLIFIDANHTLPYVTRDWRNYGPMGNIVAFHDIGWKDKPGREGKLPIQVPELWRQIRNEHPDGEVVEIRACPADNGIGIICL